MPEKIYEIKIGQTYHLSMDTWLCRVALSEGSTPPVGISILIMLKTLRANGINPHDGISIAVLMVEPVLARLKNDLTAGITPDKICIPIGFERSPSFAQKASTIYQRIVQREPFHLFITSAP